MIETVQEGIGRLVAKVDVAKNAVRKGRRRSARRSLDGKVIKSYATGNASRLAHSRNQRSLCGRPIPSRWPMINIRVAVCWVLLIVWVYSILFKRGHAINVFEFSTHTAPLLGEHEIEFWTRKHALLNNFETVDLRCLYMLGSRSLPVVYMISPQTLPLTALSDLFK